ncbi:MAG: hypothetical protein ACLRZ6_01140 [Lachnospiraceae bacterium]
MATVVIRYLIMVQVGTADDSPDVKAEVTVSFDEAAFGANKRVRLQGSDGKVQTLKLRFRRI